MFNPGEKLLNNQRYEIIQKVGSGGMGIVYRALDVNLSRYVAIKVLNPIVADERRALRDLRLEAQTAAGLQHPNIATIYDLLEWESKHFIVMEFVEGQTWEDMAIDNFPLPMERLLAIMLQICDGLEYIHERQIFHRDIKPKNIMVTPNDQVKITDFGISHVVKQTTTRMTGVMTTGTAAYMAPEQFDLAPATAHSDIYSLGISLYEIVTNDHAYTGPDFRYQHSTVKLPPPNERKPDLNIDPRLSAIVMRCVEKDPDDRFQSVNELKDSLIALQPGANAATKISGVGQQSRTGTNAQGEQEHARQAKIQALSQQAQAEWAAMRYHKVIEISQKILDLDPKNGGAKSGIESARKVLAEQQKELERLTLQAQSAQQKGAFREAIDLWKQALAVAPESQRAKAGLESAQESLAEQQKKQAENLERLQERDRLISQAQTEQNAGEFELAVQTWERVLQIEPDNQIAQSQLDFARRILYEEGVRERAERERLIQREHHRQTQIQSFITQARNAEQANQFEIAQQAWKQVLDLAPDNKVAQSGLLRVQEKLAPKKIDYAVAAASLFIHHLHREGFDHGLIATFGDTLRIEQDFTSRAYELQSALAKVQQSVGGRTRLYDSIEDVISAFWLVGERDRPWLLTIITDGIDNQSYKYKQNPIGIGRYIATHFMHERDNFVFLIGVGTGNEIDAKALGILGQLGGFPATTIAAFPLLERLFLEIALQVSQRLVGRKINIGNLSWEQIAREYQVSQVPLDYAFLIDRSTSMNSAG